MITMRMDATRVRRHVCNGAGQVAAVDSNVAGPGIRRAVVHPAHNIVVGLFAVQVEVAERRGVRHETVGFGGDSTDENAHVGRSRRVRFK